MEEFPANSNKSKGAEPVEEPKKVTKVISGQATTRKRPFGKRFTETFLGGDARSVAGNVVFEVFIPAAREMMYNTLSEGFERVIFGETRTRSRRRAGGFWADSDYGRVRYERGGSSRSSRSRDRDDEPRASRRRPRSVHDFEDVIVRTRPEAVEVISTMNDLIDKYGEVSIADLHMMVELDFDHTDEKWGWTDLRDAEVERVKSGYLLDLPRPEVLG